MKSETNSCDRQPIEQFFRQTLSPEEERALEQHVEECAGCRQRLHDGGGEASLWEEASDLLRDEPSDLEPLSSVGAAGEGHDGHDGDADIRQVLTLLAPTDDPQMLGRIGGYEVAGVIGAGGMGVVLRGFDRSLNRYVAIKVLAPHLASSGAARRRFANEAQAAAAILHENVIAIHSVAEHEGLPYLVMPYERGSSLQKRINDHGPLALNEILRIASQTASGLSAAHAQGLVHRDIKPANILLADGVERVTLTDFGLARAVDDASLTRSGVIAGTPLYMSPEQARGEAIDHSSDLFSLGSVLYAMCTGRPPFRAETSYGVLHRITNTDPRPIRELNPAIPGWLCRLIEQLHRKSPSDRPQSADAVAELLGQCVAHVQRPDSQSIPAELREAERRSGRTTWPIIAGCMLLVVVLIGMAMRPPADRGPRSESVPAKPVDRESTELPAADRSTTVNAFWEDGVEDELLEATHDLDQLDTNTRTSFED